MKKIKKTLAVFLTVLMLASSVPAAGLTAFAYEADQPLFAYEEDVADPVVPEGYYLTGKTNLDENDKKIYHIEEIEPSGDIIHEMWIDAQGNEVQNPDYPLAYPLDKNGEQILKGDELPSSYDARDDGIITPVEYQIGGTCWAHAGVAVIETAYLKKYGTTYDLSEYHTAWFGKNSYYEGQTASANDGVTKTDVIGVLNDGGNMGDVNRAMGNFSGGVLESRYPFQTEDHSNCLEDTELIEVMKETFTYDTRYQHDVVLESIKSINYDISALKQALLDYGAVQISYFSDDAYYNYREVGLRGWYVGEYQEDFQVAFYHPTMSDTNHAVTLVGWDDSFSRENFGTYKPEGDGAWLVKNSWSTDWGNDGYFWISYEDKSIQTWPSYVVEVGDVDEYDDVYLYDGIGYYGSANGCSAAANIFTARNDIYLSKISYGSTRDRDYTLRIYKNIPENATDPTAGTLVFEQSGKTNNEKYIFLEGDVKLNAGERFSVVLDISSVLCEGTSANTTCERGDSFYYKNGSWVDAADTSYGNPCIRAVGKLIEESDTYKVTFKDGTAYNETVIAADGVVELPEMTGHTYVFTYNGVSFDGTGLTQDMTVNTHCYPTMGKVSEDNSCVTEYMCIYCGKEMKQAVTEHDYKDEVIPATEKTIGYTVRTCTDCNETSKINYNLYNGADGGEATVGSGTSAKSFWWQYADGNLCVFPNEGSYDMPDFTSASATPWAAYLDRITTLTVCEDINYLGDYMFSGLTALSEINLNDELTEIGDYCFSGAKALKVFTYPKALKKVGAYAFNGAASLEEINYNGAIKTLGECVYYGCTSLKEGVVPGTVTSSGTYLFRACSSLERIVVEEGVTYVPYMAWDTPALKEIVLPSTLTLTYFMNYAYLEKYTVSPDNKVYCSVDGVVYSKDMKTLYAYPATKSDKYFAVPSGVEKINAYAFSFIKNLKYLDMSSCAVTTIVAKAMNQMQSVLYMNLPAGLTEINADGMYQTRMSNLYIPSTVTAIADGAFNTNNSTFYKVPSFYTDSEAAKIKELADANGYNCTVVHTEHNFSTAMSDMKKEPTCKDAGYSLNTCVCGSFEYKVIPATTQHSLVKVETVAPTCIEEGYTVYTCSVCGAQESKDIVAALDHSFSWITDTEATCGTDGEKHEQCTRCGVTQNSGTVIPATKNHSYKSEITVAPTHLTEGVEAFTCEACSDAYTKIIAKLTEHTYTSSVTKKATHLEEGVTTYTCECGDTYTETIAKLTAHTYEESVTAPTCTAKGYTTYTCACGDSYVDNYTEKLPHEYTSVITTEPTHLKDGIKTFTCSCGDTYTESIAKLTGHIYNSSVTKEATHLEEGVITYTCECGDTYTESVARLEGHTYEESVTAPTCTVKGYTTYTCECGASYIADEVDALGHTASESVTENRTEPTCTKKGSYDTVVYCSVCDTELSRKATELDAKGHNHGAEATCTEAQKCTVCNEELKAALGHAYGKEITKQPTHLAEGTETYTCGGCGHSYTKTIAKLKEHTYAVLKVVEPTCEAEGYTVYTCECGHSYNGDKVSATGHSYENDTCSVCGKNKSESCSCNCHKGGFGGFIWKLLRFFYKLFGINKVCECGAAHY